MGKYAELAKDIVTHVGGKENVSSLRHCITRLRFVLNDEKKADTDYLKSRDGIVTVVRGGSEYMVVIGEHVHFVYEDVCKELGIPLEGSSAQKEGGRKKGEYRFEGSGCDHSRCWSYPEHLVCLRYSQRAAIHCRSAGGEQHQRTLRYADRFRGCVSLFSSCDFGL